MSRYAQVKSGQIRSPLWVGICWDRSLGPLGLPRYVRELRRPAVFQTNAARAVAFASQRSQKVIRSHDWNETAYQKHLKLPKLETGEQFSIIFIHVHAVSSISNTRWLEVPSSRCRSCCHQAPRVCGKLPSCTADLDSCFVYLLKDEVSNIFQCFHGTSWNIGHIGYTMDTPSQTMG